MRSEAVWLTLCGNFYLIPSGTDLKFIQRALFATQGVVMPEVYEVVGIGLVRWLGCGSAQVCEANLIEYTVVIVSQ
jgi:hypothetical protein